MPPAELVLDMLDEVVAAPPPPSLVALVSRNPSKFVRKKQPDIVEMITVAAIWAFNTPMRRSYRRVVVREPQ